MILADFKDFPSQGRLLGIDWGARRIGVAISDADQGFVFARERIENKPWSRIGVSAVADLISAENIAGIVIGLPLRMDGSESETTLTVRNFARELTTYTNLPIVFVEENLTSFEAGDSMVGLKRGKINENIDSQSAKVILENAIALMKRNFS